MKEATKHLLIFYCIICIICILILISINIENINTFLVDNEDDTDFGIEFNESYFENQSIVIMDENYTIIFEGKMNNETMWNTTLTLTMTFRDFASLIARDKPDNYNMFEIVKQVADQLKE